MGRETLGLGFPENPNPDIREKTQAGAEALDKSIDPWLNTNTAAKMFKYTWGSPSVGKGKGNLLRVASAEHGPGSQTDTTLHLTPPGTNPGTSGELPLCLSGSVSSSVKWEASRHVHGAGR